MPADNKPQVEIEPCPFCRSDEVQCWPVESSQRGPLFYVHCHTCDGEGPVAPTESEAIEKWDLVSSCVWFFERLAKAQRSDNPPKKGSDK